MPREYRHIKPYENEIMEMKREGLTHRQIAERLGMRYEQIRGFFKRKNKRERMIKAGEAIKKRGRPRKSEDANITFICTYVIYHQGNRMKKIERSGIIENRRG